MKIRVKNLNKSHFYSICKVENVAKGGTLVCAFLVIAYCFWALDRGFEITDEAYYLLLSMYADSVKVFINAPQWITAGLWHLTESIMLFRAAGLLLLLTSSTLLAVGVFSTCLRFNLVAERFVSESVVVAGSVVCAMYYASAINLSPSYNLLASSGAYAAAGLVLFATNQTSFACKYILFVLTGFTVGVEVLSKPSAGIATLVLLVIWGTIFERSLVHRILGLVAIVFGTVIFAGVLLLVNSKISDAKQAFEQGMQLFRMVQTETMWARLVRYFIEFWEYFKATVIAFAIPIVAVIGYATTRRVIFAQIGLIALVITLLFGSLVVGKPTFSMQNLTFDSYLFGGFNRYDVEITAIIAMLMMVLIVSIPVWCKDWSTLALNIGLIFLPYSVAMGTGNALFTQVIGSLAPWGVLVSVLMVAHYPANFNKIPIWLIGICFIITISLQIVTSNLRPYQLSVSLTKQDQTATVGNIGEVKVDPETYKFIKEMTAAVEECDIVPGAPFIGLYNIPGVALAIQAIPLVSPWLNNREQAEFVLRRVHPEEMNSALVAFQMIGEGVFPPLPQQLSKFPFGYRYCGSAIYPYRHQRIQIWQSLAR